MRLAYWSFSQLIKCLHCYQFWHLRFLLHQKKITQRQHQCCDNSAMVLFSLKTKELLKNGLQDSIVFNENSITSIIIVHGSLK